MLRSGHCLAVTCESLEEDKCQPNCNQMPRQCQGNARHAPHTRHASRISQLISSEVQTTQAFHWAWVRLAERVAAVIATKYPHNDETCVGMKASAIPAYRATETRTKKINSDRYSFRITLGTGTHSLAVVRRPWPVACGPTPTWQPTQSHQRGQQGPTLRGPAPPPSGAPPGRHKPRGQRTRRAWRC